MYELQPSIQINTLNCGHRIGNWTSDISTQRHGLLQKVGHRLAKDTLCTNVTNYFIVGNNKQIGDYVKVVTAISDKAFHK